MSLEDLLYGLMIPSGNDAAKAIAVHVGGSIEGFVSMMNQEAARLEPRGPTLSMPTALRIRTIIPQPTICI